MWFRDINDWGVARAARLGRARPSAEFGNQHNDASPEKNDEDDERPAEFCVQNKQSEHEDGQAENEAVCGKLSGYHDGAF